MHTVRLLERAATGAAHTLRHPISSAAYAVGIVRGLATAGLRAASGHVTEGAGQSPDRHEGRETPQGVPTQRVAPAVEQDDVPPPEPTPLHEAFTTEPKAVSRSSEHGRASDAEIDAWIDQAMEGLEPDLEKGVVSPVADLPLPDDDEPLLDPGTAKAIRSESEILRKAAERDPE